MSEKALGIASNGKQMHYSVGALIVKDGKYLLLDRRRKPYGFAGVAGHIEIGETPVEAIERKVKEESNLDSVTCQILFDEEVVWNECSYGDFAHYLYLFKINVDGTDFKLNEDEGKEMGWFTKEYIKRLNLEPVWRYWFEKLGIIKNENIAVS